MQCSKLAAPVVWVRPQEGVKTPMRGSARANVDACGGASAAMWRQGRKADDAYGK
jgi:hypothetical protein